MSPVATSSSSVAATRGELAAQSLVKKSRPKQQPPPPCVITTTSNAYVNKKPKTNKVLDVDEQEEVGGGVGDEENRPFQCEDCAKCKGI